MPDLSHLWQRFLLATALVFGLALGIAATIFGYSNTATVDVSWSVVHLHGIPLWSVALVPVALVLAVGTVYHWYNSFHHFTQHMHHRRRVRELEAEVATLKTRLDHLLEMPGQAGSRIAEPVEVEAPAPAALAALPEPSTNGAAALEDANHGDGERANGEPANGEAKLRRSSRKRQAAAAVPTEPDLRGDGDSTAGAEAAAGSAVEETAEA